SDELVFDPGVVELSILLGVHEDGEAETEEYFDLFLLEPWGGARLGSQQRTRVTILDAESNGTVTHHSTTSLLFDRDSSDGIIYEEETQSSGYDADDDDDSDVVVVAGTLGNVTLVAKDALGRLRGFGGDVFEAWVEVRGEEEGETYGVKGGSVSLDGYNASVDLESNGIPLTSPAAVEAATPAMVRVEDLGSGNYTVSYQVYRAGNYLLRAALCRPGGLTGRYTSDSFFQNQEFQRVDRQVPAAVRVRSSVMNFTWGAGAIVGTATDFAGVRWSEGRVWPDYSETFEFELGTAVGGGDAARLWIDGAVIIDGFERGSGTVGDWEGTEEGLGGGGTAYVNLTAGTLHEIYVEYSERRGGASLYLAWSSPSVSQQIVPPTNLYWVRDLGSGGSPRVLAVRSALTSGEKSEAFGEGTVSAVAALPSTFTIVPRDAFGNLRVDEMDADVAPSDHFSVVLEAISYDYDEYGSATLGGVYGAAGSGGTVVTGKLEFDAENGVFLVEYVPFVAGTHLLNVTFQEWLFEPEEHVKGSPFTVTVAPGEAFGRRSDAWGDALGSSSNGNNGSLEAGVAASLGVRARDVVGNAVGEGGDELAVYAFHREVEAFTKGTVDDLGNGSYDVWITPTVAGPYFISLALEGQASLSPSSEVADSPYSVVVTPGDAYGPASSAYGGGISTAVATLDNIVYVRDRWGNNLWGSGFNVTAELYLGDSAAAATNQGRNGTEPAASNETSSNTSSSYSGEDGEKPLVTFFGNGSGIALVTYVPREAGTSFLYVHVNDLQVAGSPFEVDVSAGPARGANATASGSALALATAGKNASFIIQARDGGANPAAEESEEHADEEGMGGTAGTTSSAFNVTLAMIDGVGLDGDQEDSVNSTVVYAAVEDIAGDGKYEAVYNATKTGNYSLEVVDASDGEHAVGSPFQVVVEPNQAFAPATLVWWERQVCGSNVIHLQAVDFWHNNITQGGEAFVARWKPQDNQVETVATAYEIVAADDDRTDAASETIEEGDYWTSEDGWDDTASIAAGFFFPAPTTTNTTNASDNSGSHSASSDGDTGAYVTDVGGGRYEVTTAAVAGSYWLEIGVVEPGGLWGTYYEDSGVETEGTNQKVYVNWRTKGAVNFDWGPLSPQAGVDRFGTSPSSRPSGNPSTSNYTASEASSSSTSSAEFASEDVSVNGSSYFFFPADYFSARFTGFVKADLKGEYRFRVATDRSSRVALSVSGVELFDDLLPTSETSGGSAADMTSDEASAGTAMLSKGRTGSLLLAAGEMVPLQLRYAHATGEAWVRLEWTASRTKATEGLSVVPSTSLFHHRLGWKVAVDLHPAPTAAGASTVAVWPPAPISDTDIEEDEGDGGDEELDEEEESEVGAGGGVHAGEGNDGTAGWMAGTGLKQVTAGKMMEIVVQARDVHGNHRGVGGDSVQMYARGPGGVMLHGGAVDTGDGNYTVSAWPVMAGAYHMSVLVSSLEPSHWALGYRQAHLQAMAGAHVSGSPFRLVVVEGAVAANASLAFGVGIDSPLAGGVLGTSAARDSMGNRVSSGSTGDFNVEVFLADEDTVTMGGGVDPSPVSVGNAVYTAGGDYAGTYNVTVAGDYALHVTQSSTGGHIAGSPFSLHVSPGPSYAATSVCDDCEAIFSAEGNFSVNSTKLVLFSARDAFGNALETGGDEWLVRLRGAEEGVSDAEVRYPMVADQGSGSYSVAIKPGVTGLYEAQVLLLSKVSTEDVLADLSGRSRGGGLTAQYYTNARLAGRPLVTRIDPSIQLDWGSGVPPGVSRVGSTGGTVGIRWDGFLKAQVSGEFTFTISTGAGDESRLWIRDELAIDTFSTSPSDLVRSTSPVPDVTVASQNVTLLTAGEVVRLRAEYVHHGGGGITRAVRVVVGWESPGTLQPAQALPSFALFPSAGEIAGSPFSFSIV
ncbi:unnamed protein product, partial [Ectocarpus sp. 8 AP-2014]